MSRKAELQRARRAAMTEEQREAARRKAREGMRNLRARRPGYALEVNKRWQERNPEAYRRSLRRSHLRRTFGLTTEQFDSMVEAQNGRCALCHELPRATMHVDHDHKTGTVRGLLCSYCNRILGHVEKRPDLFQRMFDYLTNQQTKHP